MEKTPLEQFKAILAGRPRAKGWDEIGPVTIDGDDTHTFLMFEAMQMGFAFDVQGELVGGFNWKQ